MAVKIIPVIDLMGGVVVHARRGERDRYQPIRSALSASAAPLAIVDALIALGSFDTLYIADLDAIRRQGDNDRAVAAIASRHPQLALWLDRGDSDPATLAARGAAGPGIPVLGTESLAGEAAARAALAVRPLILSLDHGADGRLGPAAIHETSALWPERVIVMTLDRVGAGAGPDLARLAAVKAQAGARALYAAGGVRHAGDLAALEEAGIAGALVATALHDGRLSAADLKAR